jgi:4-alpha-glucanotransferase
MTIQFYLRYHTHFGQTLLIVGNNKYLGDNDSSKALSLSYFNEDFWKVTIPFPDDFDDNIHYKYILKDKDGTEIFDGEENRFLDVSLRRRKNYTIIDTWNAAGDIGNVFFSMAFSKVLLPPVSKIKISTPRKITHEFRVKAPLLQPGETICLCGSTNGLKNWDAQNPIVLVPKNNWFIAQVHLEENEWPATYKYGIYDLNEKKLSRFENGENRILQKSENDSGLTILHDGFVNYETTLWKGAGVSIPVFSLRSQKSFGVGEFADIK